MKKLPAKGYEKKTGEKPFIGIVGGDWILRDRNYIKTGCNAYENERPKSTPLAFWREEDIWQYIKTYKIDYCDIYDKGYSRTGCMFCGFGAHLEKEPNRFQLMQKTHPQIYNYCMKSWEDGGLGMADVLEFIGVEWKRNMQISFDDYLTKEA
jgi:3'-phosphoadenosine 5'-phosphosulfate sulfotransferase (PAPS reductase)/FAD synthetase